MVLYLDIIWLLNFLVDSFLLWVTAIFLKRRVHPIKILVGGLIGSLIILLAVTPLSALTQHPLSKALFSVVMVLVTFGVNRISTFISTLFTFYFSTFLMGGILLGTHFFLTFNVGLQSTVAIESIRGYGDPISWIFLLVAFPIAWYFSKQRVTSLTMTRIQYDCLYNVVIKINGILIELKGLVDSGNQLYDPISRKPVMVISINKVKDLLPEEIVGIVASEDSDILLRMEELPAEWRNLMRLVPSKSLGKNNQLLCAFKPESIVIKDEKGNFIEEDGLIVFSTQVLSGDGDFDVILHPRMVINLDKVAS